MLGYKNIIFLRDEMEAMTKLPTKVPRCEAKSMAQKPDQTKMNHSRITGMYMYGNPTLIKNISKTTRIQRRTFMKWTEI